MGRAKRNPSLKREDDDRHFSRFGILRVVRVFFLCLMVPNLVSQHCLAVAPELLYTGITNLELRLKGTVLFGDEFSEFGEKQNDYSIELRARYYF